MKYNLFYCKICDKTKNSSNHVRFSVNTQPIQSTKHISHKINDRSAPILSHQNFPSTLFWIGPMFNNYIDPFPDCCEISVYEFL